MVGPALAQVLLVVHFELVLLALPGLGVDLGQLHAVEGLHRLGFRLFELLLELLLVVLRLLVLGLPFLHHLVSRVCADLQAVERPVH